MRFLPSILVALSTTSLSGAPVAVDCTSDAMIVFDGSGSMAEMGFNNIDEPRIFEARRAMAEALPPIAQNRRLGLVVYGPNGVDDCSGLDVRFAPVTNAAPPILDAINTLHPTGSTPLTDAVRLAAETLEYRTQPATVLLVTDGRETCGGLPCALANELVADGADMTVHVIGFKVRGTFFSWDQQNDNDYNDTQSVARCLADTTGGTYTNAETLEHLIAALRKTLGCNLMF